MSSNRMSIRNAAKAIGRRRSIVKDLVEKGAVRAWRVGGTPKKPRLEVDVDELKKALDRETIYVPAGFTKSEAVRPRQRSVSSSQIDPAFRDL